ncbi:molybdopterin biosynthesis protein [Salinarimonas chemoclinalis]|uniref:molybdopterin biosynthesis protein n=1 Tax=Salinarimonas chemoclinalis TaxID=3241599 RepID=UPI003557A483
MTDTPAAPHDPSRSQEQFLTVRSREEAAARFARALAPAPLRRDAVALADALGLPLAADVGAPVDAPPFDRSGVDGFAVRAADLAGASEAAPVRLLLNAETIACGVAPAIAVTSGRATPIATGGPIPRGADAVVMIEHTRPLDGPDGPAVAVRRAANPGQFVAFAGSDIARGEMLLRAGTVVGAREIGMLAAVGIARVPVFARPRVAVLSTGDELVAPGEALGPARIYDANGPVIAAAIAECGCTPVPWGIVPDDPSALEAALRRAHAECDAVVLSGGTSKGAGDLTYRAVAGLGAPGIVAHGVALKPGKPLCLAVCDGKAVVVLPGFPTSAMFTFHDMIAPVLRILAGLPTRAEARVRARVPVRIASELGRTEYVMSALVAGEGGLVAYPTGKGSGSVTTFAQADGFLTIEALADALPAGAEVDVRLLTSQVSVPDLVIAGSHCTGLDAVIARLPGVTARVIAVGSLGGLAAANRGECDLAPIHLLDPKNGAYNAPFLTDGLALVPGWRRMQGVVFRKGDDRFEGRDAREAVAAAKTDPACLMVGRNQGAGTRILLDGLLAGARPDGYWNQPRSHNAVAAAVAQGRADWGLAIAPVAEAYGLGFLPLAEEHYDFALVAARRARPGVAAFLAALAAPETHAALRALGFTPAPRS